MIDIFRKRDATAVGRYFGASFIQHDPTLADGVAGMKSFATEIASSPPADITIYRTLVDGNFVLLHSKYQGDGRYREPAISFDLFRFDGGKIVEHWGGQEPEAPPNLSGRTQVDGPTVVLDRDKTEANRTLVRAYILKGEKDSNWSSREPGGTGGEEIFEQSVARDRTC
jgi:predicted SnoaL-like aldol condensation-catalyzing enzyme